MKTSVLFLLLAASCCAQTLITSLPYTITAAGSYQLVTPISYYGTSGAAITIAADHVRLWLGDGALYLPGGSSTQAVGIEAYGRAGVRIRGGAIRGALYGVRLEGCPDARVADLDVSAWYIGIIAGVSSAPSDGALVQGCTVRGVGGSTISSAYARPTGIWVSGQGVRVRDCAVIGVTRPPGEATEAMGVNVVSGAAEISGCVIAQPVALSRTYGVWTNSPDTVVRGTSISQWGCGIGVPSGARCVEQSVAFTGCTTDRN